MSERSAETELRHLATASPRPERSAEDDLGGEEGMHCGAKSKGSTQSPNQDLLSPNVLAAGSSLSSKTRRGGVT